VAHADGRLSFAVAYDVPPGIVPEIIELHADPISAGVQIPLS
jgi:hypothetical protein